MITLTDVRKKIDKNFELGPLSLTIEPGNITALIGNNGAGKSTLFQLIMGLIKYEQGEIIRGQEGRDGKWKDEIAYVPQTALTYYGLTLKQVAEFFQLAYATWNEQEYRRLIKLFHLPCEKRFEQLSIGMQKKAMLLLALCRPSKLLLLDEPLAGVDLEGQEQMKDELVSYMERREEQTILFATHSADEVKTLADYILLLKEGTLLGHYEKDELLATWKRIWIKLDEEKAGQIAGVLHAEEHGEWTECVTANIEMTELNLGENKVKIESEQVMELREILRYLLSE